jgi:23S rRNA (uracil1939-C5)-methyltransferase
MTVELTISRLGSQGDGVAETANGAVYVPFTLPAERVEADLAENGRSARLVRVLTPAANRVEPVCRHFGECGGCALQHMERGAYQTWKRQRVVDALASERIAIAGDAEVEPLRTFPLGTRRRATLAADKTGSALQFGFRRASSHDIVPLAECPVLAPRIVAALPGLGDLLAKLLPQGDTRVSLTVADNGLDVALEPASPRAKCAKFTPAYGKAAEALGIVRITAAGAGAGGGLIFSVAAPQVTLAGVTVDLPPGAFLQAVAEAEDAIAELAVEAIGKTRVAADLFCGLGTFTFALAQRASVTAVENDRVSLAALEAAARRAQKLKPINTLCRDLLREPLSPVELAAFGAVLFDPPRAGALAQAKALARSKVPVVVAVSCNPATFARDARALIDGGYALKRVMPVDQFVFSPHVEVAAVFAQPVRRR